MSEYWPKIKAYRDDFIKNNPGYKIADILVECDDDEPLLNTMITPKPYEKVNGKWQQMKLNT